MAGNRGFLVVGYSLRDRRVRELVESSGGSVWFTHPTAVPAHLRNNKSMRTVVAPECAFEAFFPALAKALGVAVPEKPLDAAQLELHSVAAIDAGAQRIDAGGQTMDDLMSSTLAIDGPSGPSSTAFLLAEPRVIVCDRHVYDPDLGKGSVHLIDSRGHRVETRVLHVNLNHPFGPAVLEAPIEIRAPGLHLEAAALSSDEEVQILVAAGAETGISSGKVTALEMVTSINPMAGEVRDLVELECFVAPGASGAPVVDSRLSVRGFIVAGSTDPHDPRSYAYPAQHWASFVLGHRAG